MAWVSEWAGHVDVVLKLVACAYTPPTFIVYIVMLECKWVLHRTFEVRYDETVIARNAINKTPLLDLLHALSEARGIEANGNIVVPTHS